MPSVGFFNTLEMFGTGVTVRREVTVTEAGIQEDQLALREGHNLHLCQFARPR